MQGARNDTNSLELGAGVADGVLVDGEGLREELVAELFETCLVRHLAAHYKETEGKIGASRVDALVEVIDALVHKPIER